MSLGLPGDRVAAAARAGRARAALRLRRATAPRAARVDVAAAALVLARRPPDLRGLRLLPFAGFLVVRVAPRARRGAAHRGRARRVRVPAAAFFAWLLPVVRDTRSRHARRRVRRARALAHYADQLDVSRRRATGSRPRCSAAAARSRSRRSLLAAARGARRAPALGGVRARRDARRARLTLVPRSSPRFSDAVSLSQSRRAAGFVPFAVAFAGGLGVLARALRVFVLPRRCSRGSRSSSRIPGDFAYRLERRRPGGRDVDRGRPAARRRSSSALVRAAPRGERLAGSSASRRRLRAPGRRARPGTGAPSARAAREPAHTRPRRGAARASARAAPSSSPTSRRATASRPSRRCTSRPRPRSRGRHGEEPAVRAAQGGAARSSAPATSAFRGAPARAGSSSTAPLPRGRRPPVYEDVRYALYRLAP